MAGRLDAGIGADGRLEAASLASAALRPSRRDQQCLAQCGQTGMHAVYPLGFSCPERHPVARPGQTAGDRGRLSFRRRMPMGGFVYAGATMAFTAGILGAGGAASLGHRGLRLRHALSEDRSARISTATGLGRPLAGRISRCARSRRKSARLMVLAAMQGCAMVNLSVGPSRLIFPRLTRHSVARWRARNPGAPIWRPKPWHVGGGAGVPRALGPVLGGSASLRCGGT